MKNPRTYHEGGVRKLLAGMLEQAVEDHKAFERLGVTRNGQITGKWPGARVIFGMKKAEAVSLTHFFNSPALDASLALAGLQYSAGTVRHRLNIKTKS